MATTYLQTASSGDLKLVFTRPLVVNLSDDGRKVVASLPEFGLFAPAATAEAALAELQKDLVWLWREYGEADDAELSGDARKLKQAMKKVIREVWHFVRPCSNN
jgi:hypothetical protein